jgi:hypothetical protein
LDLFFKAARKWHPDKNPDNPQAEVKFKAISEAYEVRFRDPLQVQVCILVFFQEVGKVFLFRSAPHHSMQIFRHGQGLLFFTFFALL